MAALASAAARALYGSPLWPLTQCQVMVCCPARWYSVCQRSPLAIRRPLPPGLERQPLAAQRSIHCVMPLRRYSESVKSVTWLAPLSARSAWMAAVSSMRLLVVSGSAPLSSFV